MATDFSKTMYILLQHLPQPAGSFQQQQLLNAAHYSTLTVHEVLVLDIGEEQQMWIISYI